MLPDPLHPAVVHFPMALAILLPLAALVLLYWIRRGAPVRTAWSGVVVAAGLLLGSSWLSLQTGEREEERVEEVVAEQAIGTHEELAEQFMILAGVVFLLSAAGLISHRAGGWARTAATVGSLLLIPAGIRVGHSGGELVYQHGAASAYTGSGGLSSGDTEGTRAVSAREDREEDREEREGK